MNLRQLSAAMAIAVLLSVTIIGSGAISYEISARAEGSTISSDPFNLDAAPNLRDVTYTLTPPTYLQRFDALGKWKTSAGYPTITVSDSLLTLASTARSEITLSTGDAPGLNARPTAYIEFRMKAVAGLANITAMDASGNLARISVTANTSASYVCTTSSGNATGLLTSSISTSWTTVGIEIAPTGVTFYTTGTTFFLNNAVLKPGNLAELRLSILGGSMKADYFFVSAEVPATTVSQQAPAVDVLSATQAVTKSGLRVDMTKLDVVRSSSQITQDLYGRDDSMADDGYLNLTDMIDALGTTDESMQRLEGTHYSKGWSNFRADLEKSLRTEIGIRTSTRADRVYLIDYYMTNVEFRTRLDYDVAKTMENRLEDSFQAAAKAMGLDPEVTGNGQGTVYSIVPYATFSIYQAASLDLAADLGQVGYTVNPLNWPEIITRTVASWAWGGISGDIGDKWDAAMSKIPSMDQVQSLITQNAKELEGMFSSQQEKWAAVLNTTTEQFISMSQQNMASMFSWCSGTVNNITGKFGAALDSLTDMNREYMTWANQQIMATNAMFAQLFDRMERQMSSVTQTFGNATAKVTDAVTNVTEGVAKASDAFAGILTGGKPVDGAALSLSGLFGSAWVKQNIILVVLVGITLIILVVAIMIRIGNSGNGGRRR